MDVRAVKAIKAIEEKIRKKEKAVKRKVIKIILIIVTVIIYFNIGYLVTYSTNSAYSQTPVTQLVSKIMNFYDVLPMEDKGYGSIIFAISTVMWPLSVIFSWVINFAFMIFDIVILIFTGILNAIEWIFNGGFWKLIGFIK